jgi:hypothetical protein
VDDVLNQRLIPGMIAPERFSPMTLGVLHTGERGSYKKVFEIFRDSWFVVFGHRLCSQ